MSSLVAQTSRRLPRGWAHLAFQFVIWMGFYVVYQIARGAADRDVYHAFQNGEWVLRRESQVGALFEPAVQRVVDTSSILVTLTSYTYWLSQFAVVGITLLWVYFRHQERFAGFRNWLIFANLVGLLGYVFMEGSSFGDVPLNVELKLEVWDSPNSAGIVIDAVRLAKLALNNGISGALEAPSARRTRRLPGSRTVAGRTSAA